MAPALGPDDPSVRMLRSGFGKQTVSGKDSQPAFGFGTAHRDAVNKLYLSQEQTKAMQGDNSQGPVYKSYGAVGPQPESKYATLPVMSFGTSARNPKDKHSSNMPGPGAYKHAVTSHDSKRPSSSSATFGTATRDMQSKVWLDDELMKTYSGRESPGPNSYLTRGALGKQTDSRYSTEPGWGVGTSPRFNHKSHAGEQPGVGTYLVNNNASGKQVLSQKKTLPSAKIGTGTRDAFKRVYISKEHEKGAFGKWSPGPVTSKMMNSFGTQTQSVKKTNPSWGFGSSKRSIDYANDSPGPGAYYA